MMPSRPAQNKKTETVMREKKKKVIIRNVISVRGIIE